jgi:GTP cyclohydrolase I
MPDVAKDAIAEVAGRLDWVGMNGIDMPVTLATADGGAVRSLARIAAYVNLVRADARGIHMSRLHQHLDRALSAEALSPCAVRRLLRDFVDSHATLADRALLRVRFEQLARRPALVSEHGGWKAYPVTITGVLERGQCQIELAFEVLYSSTCPCSAALARQVIQQRFAEQFGAGAPLDRARVLDWLGSEQGIAATPHSQRSAAEIRVRLVPSFASFPIIDLIDLAESALQTAVQTAVKREDEQAFAVLNGANPMFCEDAARRLQAAFDADPRVADFWIRATHFESLHAHDAVAVATKGVAGGYGRAELAIG